MDIEDLTRIAGGKRLPELVECGDVDASLYAPDLLSAGVGFGFDAGDDTTLHMLNVRDDTTATEKGVHVGSTQTQLTEVYGDDLQPLAGANAPSFTVEAGAHLLVFRIDEATQVVNSMGTVALGDTAHAVELVNTVC
ncbi:MAG: hypothetical protein Q4F67_09810 [Propionibacteriaceae bacterium]|nr:hypothetical protein [Propionibacteriaceae bacterium]